MKRIKTENNPLLTNENPNNPKGDNNKGRGLKKMIIINNNILWRGITYNENFSKMLVEFCSTPKYRKRKDKATWLMVKEAYDYPTVAWFRVKHKIPSSKWSYWINNYEELREAVELVKDMQEDMLVNNGLNWLWNAQVVKSVGMSDLNWTDKKETTTRTESITEDQKKKMLKEYMEWLEQKWEIIQWEILESKPLNDEWTANWEV